MFTSMRSVTAKLAVTFAPRLKASAATVAKLQSSTQPYDPKLYEELFMRLRVVRAQDRTALGRIRRVLGMGRKLGTGSAPSPVPATPAVTISEDFGVPCIVITEAAEAHLDQMGPQALVQTYPDDLEDLNSPYTMYEFELYEADPSVSTFPEDVSHADTDASDYQDQDLSSILGESEHEWGSSDIEYSSTLRAEQGHDDILSEWGTENDVSLRDTEAGDDSGMPASWSGFHGDEVASPLVISNEGNLRTASPISTLFCPPTPVSTLAPLTPSEGESGPSTSRYTPVLVHESESYEKALYAEFMAIIGDTDGTWNKTQDAPGRD